MAAPQFCPWCGTPIGYEEHEHEPRFTTLAEQARAHGAEPPPLPARVQELLAEEPGRRLQRAVQPVALRHLLDLLWAAFQPHAGPAGR